MTCDIDKGIRDDASGTITGTANKMLRLPADVTKFILLAMFPGVTAADLGTHWSGARTTHDKGDCKWDCLLTKAERPHHLEDNPDITDRSIEFRMSDASLMLEDKMMIRPLTNDAFPLVGDLPTVETVAAGAQTRASTRSSSTCGQNW